MDNILHFRLCRPDIRCDSPQGGAAGHANRCIAGCDRLDRSRDVPDRGWRAYVNELAPRPHNSGHYTMEACRTSQFEQHVRAICNLPLGSTELLTPVVMVNILGEHVEPLYELAAGANGGSGSVCP